MAYSVCCCAWHTCGCCVEFCSGATPPLHDAGLSPDESDGVTCCFTPPCHGCHWSIGKLCQRIPCISPLMSLVSAFGHNVGVPTDAIETHASLD